MHVLFYRLHEKKKLDYVLENLPRQYYSYYYRKLLNSKNINPIIIDNLVKNVVTKDPINTGKRQSGRPVTVRIKKWALCDENFSIKCSICKNIGHNKRSCKRQPHSGNDAVCEVINNPF